MPAAKPACYLNTRWISPDIEKWQLGTCRCNLATSSQSAIYSIMHAKHNCSHLQQGRGSVVSYDGMRRVAPPAAPRPQPVRRSRPQAVSNVAEMSRIERAAADPATVKTTNRPKVWPC